ncbi:PREDICTED: interleukin-23 subunit alpha [Nipponia nippon]|uniref:interleukin-23 subunit alpha n=1 Tax=Nipponia nippon TaxID=128390 RepID=UPI000510EF3C|nr:PREDICTED: interleukin-23 subunit alpha [Nipponia nippon]
MCPGVSEYQGLHTGVPGPRLRPCSPQRCLRRILQGLRHYRDLLGSDIFTARPLPRLETTLDQLLGLVQQEHGHLSRHPMAPSEAWAHPLLQRLALQRLQSFTAIMSRVFTHSASPR